MATWALKWFHPFYEISLQFLKPGLLQVVVVDDVVIYCSDLWAICVGKFNWLPIVIFESAAPARDAWGLVNERPRDLSKPLSCQKSINTGVINSGFGAKLGWLGRKIYELWCKQRSENGPSVGVCFWKLFKKCSDVDFFL